MTSETQPFSSQDVVTEELKELQLQWAVAVAQRGPFPKDKLGGLALSGGGIRSASFAFGVMQALASSKADAIERQSSGGGHPSLLQRLQYLSTVSGGGFAGTAVTRAVNIASSSYDLAEEFPFRVADGAAAPAPVDEKQVESDGKPAAKDETPSRLSDIRYKASYLDMSSGGSKLTAIVVVIRTIVLTSLIYLLGAAGLVGLIYPIMLNPPKSNVTFLGVNPNGALVLSLVLLLLLFFSWIWYSLKSGINPSKNLSWTTRLKAETSGGKFAFYALMAGAISLVGYFPVAGFNDNSKQLMPSIALVLGTLGTVGAFVAQFRTLFGGLSDKRWLPAILVWASGIALMAALLIGGRELALAWNDVEQYDHLLTTWSYWAWIALLLLAFAGLGWYGNVNYIGLHRFYRDRLMLTFISPEQIQTTDNAADNLKLDEMGNIEKGLYPLINANVVLVNSPNPKFKVRGGDSYLLSPWFTGSAATGWAPTKFRQETEAERETRSLMNSGAAANKSARRLPDPGLSTVSLASAMAISGAALNPSTGSEGEGPTRSGMLPIILSLLGIRLGYWQPNPKRIGGGSQHFKRPNFIVPGLWHGVLQRGHTEEAKWLEITDGGHFENMGLYELFRRRVKLIIVADGSTDPDFAMTSFAGAYERARNDFGVSINISEYPANFNDMMPDSARPNSSIKRRYRLAEHGFAIGVFSYENDPLPGYIFYINTVLTENLNSNLYSYRAEHPEFPDEPLSDQFFNEKQFDAYCQLGRELTHQMIDYARGYAELADALGLKRSTHFKYWDKLPDHNFDSPEEFIGAKLDGLREALHASKLR